MTLRAPVRLRNGREHQRLARRLRDGAELHNALAEFDRGIRSHNRRCFLRHPCDCAHARADFQPAEDPQDPDRVARQPTYFDRTRMLAKGSRSLRTATPSDPLVSDWTTREPRGIVHDCLGCRDTPAKIGRFRRALRSCTSREPLRHTPDGTARQRVETSPKV